MSVLDNCEVETMNTTQLIKTDKGSPSRVIGAKNIRLELRAAFPKTKFRVHSCSFANGNSIEISWEDGPTIKQVEGITDKYQYGDFDGMTDSYNMRKDSSFNDLYGGSKYVSCYRKFSDAAIQAAIDNVIDKYGSPENGTPTVEAYNSGNIYV